MNGKKLAVPDLETVEICVYSFYDLCVEVVCKIKPEMNRESFESTESY